MKLKLSVFVGVVLCLVLMGLYGVLSRMFDSRDGWRPNDVYSLVGGSSYSTVSYSSSSSQFGGAGVPAVSVRRGSSFSRRAAAPAFSYAPASAPTYSQSSIGGTPSNSVASPIYTTSSATMKSFGGGGNVATSAFGGATGNANSISASASAGVSVSMPSTSMYAYANNRTSTSSIELPSAMSGEITLATASSYAGIGNTTAGGPRGLGGRRNVPGVGGSWVGWLSNGDYWGEGYEGWAGGSDQVTEEMLRALYVRATGDTDFSNEELWQAFLAWFNSMQSDETFGWHWAPLSDAIPFVLLLSLLYAWFIYRKTKKQTA